MPQWLRFPLLVLGVMVVTVLISVGLVRMFPVSPNAPEAAPLTLPVDAKGEVGDWIEVKATTRGKLVRWRASRGLKLAPSSMRPNSHVAVVSAPRSGNYELRAWTAVDGLPTEDALCRVVVGDVPPGPGPGPGPDPVPPAPEPSDSFYQSLKAAWAEEGAADRAKRDDLAALYRQGATVAGDPKLTTFKGLLDLLHTARLSMIGEALPKVRAVLTRQLNRDLPTSASAPLDAAGRELCARTFGKVADYLGRLPR